MQVAGKTANGVKMFLFLKKCIIAEQWHMWRMVVPGGLDLKPSACSTLSNKPWICQKDLSCSHLNRGWNMWNTFSGNYKKHRFSLSYFVIHLAGMQGEPEHRRTPCCQDKLRLKRSWKFLGFLNGDVRCTVLKEPWTDLSFDVTSGASLRPLPQLSSNVQAHRGVLDWSSFIEHVVMINFMDKLCTKLIP